MEKKARFQTNIEDLPRETLRLPVKDNRLNKCISFSLISWNPSTRVHRIFFFRCKCTRAKKKNAKEKMNNDHWLRRPEKAESQDSNGKARNNLNSITEMTKGSGSSCTKFPWKCIVNSEGEVKNRRIAWVIWIC